MTTLKIKLLRHACEEPKRGTQHSSGIDLQAAISSSMMIRNGSWLIIPTGICVSIERGFDIQIRPRSGLAAKHGVTVLNSPGTIDSDYRGEIKVTLINHGINAFRIERGDRIAQMVIGKVYFPHLDFVGILDETERGEGGLGSTGDN